MPRTPSPSPQLWPPPWARTVAFFFGIAVTIYELRWDESKHLFVYGIAFLFTGLPVARGLDKVAEFLSGLFGK